MAVPVIMPKLEMSQETATVIEWTKHEGDRIEKGEPLLTVETDKVTVEVDSPASGILAGVSAEPQQVVPVTEIIAYVLQPGEALPKGPRAAAAPVQQIQVTPVATAATPVAQRMASAHGVELSNLTGTGPGQRITKEDVEAALITEPGAISTARSGKVRATPAARRVAHERGVDLVTVTGTGPRGRVQAVDVPVPHRGKSGRHSVGCSCHPPPRNATHHCGTDDVQLPDRSTHHAYRAGRYERL